MSNLIQHANELQDTMLDKSHYRNIRISVKVADRLQSKGKMSDSYNSVIEKLLDQVDQGYEIPEDERSF
jgi:hypothetical protein